MTPTRYEIGCQLLLTSGVTKVGDTRGGNWGCHPSIFSWKPGELFSRQFCGDLERRK